MSPGFLRALALLLAAALAGCECRPEPAKAAPPVAQLVSLRGAVTLTRGDQPAAPAAAGPLLAGDLITTAQKSSALLRSVDGRELELGEATRFRLGERLGQITLDLQAGVISIVAGGEAGTPGLSVRTPFGATNVPSGAQATLAVGAADLAIDVALGTITVVTEDGGQQTASAGQKLALTLGSIEVVDAAAPPPTEPVPPELVPIELVLSPEAGTPLVRREGEARFGPASKAPAPVAAGTAFRLPAGARARLSTEGLDVQLAPGATGTVGRAQREGDQRRVELQLASGSALALFGIGDRTLALGGRGKEITVHARGEASVAIEQTAKGPRLDVRAGEVEVVSGGPAQRVKAGELADLTGAAPKVKARARPSLVLPARKKLRLYGFAPGELAVGWPAAEGPVRVQVASDAAFANLLLAGKVREPYTPVAAPASGELHWRVLDEAGDPVHVGEARFEPDRAAQKARELPKSDVAETGLKSTVFFQSVLPTLNFTFPATEGAARYRMRVYRATELAKPLIDREVAEPHCTVDSGLLAEGHYAWYAAPLDAGGNEKAGGRMNKLEIVFDNTLTTLAIDRPRPGERAGPGTLASGIAPLGSQLSVNGKPVALDEKGRFSQKLVGTEAVFRLVDRSGHESYWVRRLKRR